MNPLNFPWKKARPTKPAAVNNHTYFGRIAEAQERAKNRVTINIELRGISSRPGVYKAEYVEDQVLKRYLEPLGLKHTAIYAAVYDVTRPERGRLRLTYVPQRDSSILICPPAYGLASGHQRTEVDVYQLMSKMKG